MSGPLGQYPLTPFERAAIETLEVAVLVPFRRGPDLFAFWCLGPKRSGDIYTPTDLALLGAVAGKVAGVVGTVAGVVGKVSMAADIASSFATAEAIDDAAMAKAIAMNAAMMAARAT